IRSGAAVKAFVEQTYANYKRLEKSRELNAVVDYLVQAERSGQPTECKLIFGCVLLENLKHSYARSTKIPFVRGFFRRGPGPKAPTYGFEELLTMMLRDVGMRRGLKRIVKMR